MSFSPETIDRIVANVLSQLSGSRPVQVAPSAAKLSTPASATPSVPARVVVAPSGEKVALSEAVITADKLEAIAIGATVQVGPKAIITPASQDVIRTRKLLIERQSQLQSKSNSTTETQKAASSVGSSLLIVVNNVKPLDQLWTEVSAQWTREFVACPDDAARLAAAEVSRGGASTVVILTEQTHRAACLANRNERVKAVAIRDAGDIRLIRKQLRVNTWCLDGTGKSYFELKNLFREMQSK
ncbi:hypothetical protein [Planctomicrobium sp. SH527]|uniref:hypothetical protein n=1 Tax=Planctomicrobium sp. SH527 TaxID=3448123 RepID=UPI003F5C7D5D